MFPYRIVFSDIDETLLTADQKVTMDTRLTIQALENAGIPFVLVSARMPTAIIPITKMLESSSPVISYSGAMIQNGAGAIIQETTIAPEPLTHFLRMAKKRYPQVILNYYTGFSWYVRQASLAEVQKESREMNLLPVEADFYDLISQNRMPHKLLCMGSPSDCAQMEETIRREIPGLFAVRSYSNMLEIMNAGVNKASGIQKLLDIFHIHKEEAIAFGDSLNDLSMLEYVGCGVAMGNALEEVKKRAHAVTLSNNEDGIAEYLKKVGFAVK